MRPALVLTGFLILALGVLLYVLEIPFAFSWSIPFMVGGVVLMVAGSLAKDVEEHIEPPSGYRFCAFCNTPVVIGDLRCGYCNGLQPTASHS